MNKVFYTITILLLISLTSCRFWGVRGSGDFDSELRDVEEFTEIEIHGGAFNVDVHVGEETEVEVAGDDNLLKYIETYVRGNTLIVDTRKELNPRESLKITISTPTLEGFDASGASDIWIEGLNESRFYFSMSGACSVEAEGEVDRFKLSISGAGDVDARRVHAKEVTVSLSGAASADVYASESIDASVSGVGSVDFWGDPKYVDTDVSGIGSINER